MLQSETKNRIDVKFAIDSPDATTIGNSGQLHQAFVNLLTNAVQSIEGNGTIQISIDKSDDSAIVKIVDDGCGIPESSLSKILEPFFTTKPPGAGTGLGLFNYVQHHCRA